jgi:hypothetical protein
MKKFIITEEERKHILSLYEQSNVGDEQSIMPDCVTNDEMIKVVGYGSSPDGSTSRKIAIKNGRKLIAKWLSQDSNVLDVNLSDVRELDSKVVMVNSNHLTYVCMGYKKVKTNDNQSTTTGNESQPTDTTNVDATQQSTDVTDGNTNLKTTKDDEENNVKPTEDKIITNYDRAYDYKLTSDDKVYFKGKQGTKYGNKYTNWSEPLSSNAEDAIRTKVFKQ